MEPVMAAMAVWLVASVQIGCAALMALRLCRWLPAWSRAARKTHGVGWASLAFERRAAGPGAGADPRGLAALLVACLMFGAGGVASVVDGRFEGALESALKGEPDWLSIGMGAVYTLMFSLSPLMLLGRAMRDETSPLGAALQEESGMPLAKARAAKEARELFEAVKAPKPGLPGPKRGSSKPRL